MTLIAAAAERLGQASTLPELLGAAFDAFEDMLSVVDEQQNPASRLFVAFVMSGVAAADGRDALVRAPSLPLHRREEAGPVGRTGSGETDVPIASALCELSGQLSSRLTDASAAAESHADREACQEATRHAEEIRLLLGEAGQ
jgi:hypothetical protein